MFAAFAFFVIGLCVDASPSTCQEYYNSSSVSSIAARTWCQDGSYFKFASARNGGRVVNVFYRCSGDAKKPALVMGHGWPTSSYDFQNLVRLLDSDFYVCAVDYAGHGFSDKPSDKEYSYSLFEHADVIEELVSKVVPLSTFSYFTHDEGDSVGFEVLSRYEKVKKPYTIEHHIFMNGGIYLPLTHLSLGQKMLLSNLTGPIVEKFWTGSTMAEGMAIYGNPVLNRTEVAELATVFDYQGGSHVMHGTIQYQNERMVHEDEWLDALGRSPVPSTMIWGKNDPVCVARVGEYVWNNYLQNRTSAPATVHWLETASHYPQYGGEEAIAEIVRTAIGKKVVLI